MLEGDSGSQPQIAPDHSSSTLISLKPVQELLSTPGGRAVFEERIRRGFETYARVVHDELPIEQRPEFRLSESSWHKIY